MQHLAVLRCLAAADTTFQTGKKRWSTARVTSHPPLPRTKGGSSQADWDKLVTTWTSFITEGHLLQKPQHTALVS